MNFLSFCVCARLLSCVLYDTLYDYHFVLPFLTKFPTLDDLERQFRVKIFLNFLRVCALLPFSPYLFYYTILFLPSTQYD